MWHQELVLISKEPLKRKTVLQRTIKEPLFLRVSLSFENTLHRFEAERLHKMKKHLTHIYCTFFDCSHTLSIYESTALSVDDLFRQSMSRGRWLVSHEVLHRAGWGDGDRLHTYDCTMPFDSRNNWSNFEFLCFKERPIYWGVLFYTIEKYLFTIFSSLRNCIDSF